MSIFTWVMVNLLAKGGQRRVFRKRTFWTPCTSFLFALQDVGSDINNDWDKSHWCKDNPEKLNQKKAPQPESFGLLMNWFAKPAVLLGEQRKINWVQGLLQTIRVWIPKQVIGRVWGNAVSVTMTEPTSLHRTGRNRIHPGRGELRLP